MNMNITYEDMIRHTAGLLCAAVNTGVISTQEAYYNKADGYAEATALIFGKSYSDTWKLAISEAEEHMLGSGDARAANRWHKFWN